MKFYLIILSFLTIGSASQDFEPSCQKFYVVDDLGYPVPFSILKLSSIDTTFVDTLELTEEYFKTCLPHGKFLVAVSAEPLMVSHFDTIEISPQVDSFYVELKSIQIPDRRINPTYEGSIHYNR